MRPIHCDCCEKRIITNEKELNLGVTYNEFRLYHNFEDDIRRPKIFFDLCQDCTGSFMTVLEQYCGQLREVKTK